MGVRFSVNLWLSFLAGERVLLPKIPVWLASGKSFPSYRIFPALPPLWEAAAYVTDRRVLLVLHVLRCLIQEVDLWYPGRGGAGDREWIEEVTAGRSRTCGPYLQLTSVDPVTHWYRSRRARIRLYTRRAEEVRRAIAAAMAPDAQDS